jgi:RND family efflux transporter MFP subunit
MTRLHWLGLTTLLLVAGCNREPVAGTGNPAIPVLTADDAVSVNVVSPKKQSLTWAIEQPGSVQAFELTPVIAKLPGFVSKVHVDLGDRVTAETLLAEVSIPELVQEVKQKEAMVEQCAAEVEQAKSGVDAATEHVIAAVAVAAEAAAGRARVTADIERWESELKRIEGLVGGKVVDSQTLDETRKQYKTAAAARDETLAKIASAEAMVAEASAKKRKADSDVIASEARRRVAAADAERSKALLGYTQIRAPFAGVVTARNVHTGHFLQPGNGKPEPLFVIARLDTVRVVVDVPESAAEQTKPKTQAVVKFPTLGGREVSATVTRASGVVNPESRTQRVEIDLPNPDGVLTPGVFVSVRIVATAKEAFTVPAGAVLFTDETAYLFAVQDGKVVKLRVQTGRTDGGTVEVRSQRKAGDTAGLWQPIVGAEQFVVGHLGALTDGQAVTVSKP